VGLGFDADGGLTIGAGADLEGHCRARRQGRCELEDEGFSARQQLRQAAGKRTDDLGGDRLACVLLQRFKRGAQELRRCRIGDGIRTGQQLLKRSRDSGHGAILTESG
jgi:hypothetical protein